MAILKKVKFILMLRMFAVVNKGEVYVKNLQSAVRQFGYYINLGYALLYLFSLIIKVSPTYPLAKYSTDNP